MKTGKYTEKEKQYIIQEKNIGKTIRKISKKLDRKYESVKVLILRMRNNGINIKKSHGGVRGNKSSGNRKLTKEAVQEIRRLRTEEGVCYESLAATYKVTAQNIGAIISRKTWKKI